MTAATRRVTALLLLALATAPVLIAQTPAPTPPAPATPLVNQREPLPGVTTGGAPKSPEGFAAVAAAGIHTFVDLRTEAEVAPETRAAVEAAGMSYVRLPIAGEADLDLPSARALDALLDNSALYPLAIACSSGNRSGALLAVDAFWLDGRPAVDALALGQRAGLTRLEPSVRTLLGLPPLPLPPIAPESASGAPAPRN